MMCQTCIHRMEIPGNCHISCGNFKANPERKNWPGCGLWPINFDENIIVSCHGFSNDPKDKTTQNNPLLDLARLLAR